MISEKMQDAFNKHVVAEFYSAHLYLAMSAYFEAVDLPGFANWVRVQYQEEVFHAEKLFDYISERDGRAILKSVDEPPSEWESATAAFDHIYEHEQMVTGLINALVDLALEEKDHTSGSFLRWFLDEQVEEEASAKAIAQQLKMVGGSKEGLYMIDRELAQRVFTPSQAEA